MGSNRRIIEQMPFIYNTVEPSGVESPERSFERLRSRINETTQRSEGPLWPNPHPKRRSVITSFYRLSAAAVLLLMLGLGVRLWVAQKERESPLPNDDYPSSLLCEQEYFSPKGTRSRILLPDNTSVWLNAGSSLLVDKHFGEGQRVTRLIGEAYFEVAKDSLNPFIVRTSDVEITVLGTVFIVSAYPEDKEIRTVLVEGVVALNAKTANDSLGQSLQLKRAQMASFQKEDHQVTIQENVPTESYTSWRNETLSFNDAPMFEVVKSLERWFNVTIELEDEEIKSYIYTASFTNRTLEQILTYLSYSAPISYALHDDMVILTPKR